MSDFKLQVQSELFKKGQVVRDARDGYIYEVSNPDWWDNNQCLGLEILGDAMEWFDGMFWKPYRYMEVIAETVDEYRKNVSSL